MSETVVEAGSTKGTTAADIVVDVLSANGVSVVFALPGEENLPVVSAMRRAELPLVVCRHEQHAGFMAVAHARLTGGIAVCLATLGPGALNLFTPLAQAGLMRVPFLALTGQKPQRDNEEGSFQVLDIVGAAAPISTKAVKLQDPRATAAVMADAIRSAVTPPGGAVLVELPEDVAGEVVDDRLGGGAPRIDSPLPVAHGATLDRLVERIKAAELPVLLVGSGAAHPRIVAPLLRLCETTGLSVLATQMGKGVLDESHPRSLRSLGIHRPDHAHLALDAADLVIAVGYRPTEHPPLAWQGDRDLPIIHVDVSPGAREPGYQPEFDVVGDLVHALDSIAASGITVATDWSDAARNEIVARLDAEGDTSSAIDPLTVVRVLRDLQRPGDVVALDNGVYKIWFARHYPSLEPFSLMMDNTTASMGAGLAMATEAARLGHRALAVVGDGGLLMNVGDLETAVRIGADLTVLVLRDDEYGFIGWHQEEQGRVRHAVRLGNPDLVKLIEAFDGDGRRVETADQLRIALSDFRDRPGVHLIDCPIDYAINEIL